ncbi:RagB/SusD family nutrient uptake outer membrane protein [Flagellimonas marinaquae]|nr:RagB/SusD family nutrient uptake outer membrane protein [Allomuricauda aquimarina]
MKKSNLIILFFILLIGFLGCNEDFTESPAIGSLSDQALQNETGVDLLLVGAYSALDGVRNNSLGEAWGTGGDNWWIDVISDDAHKGATDGDQPALYNIETMNWTTGNSYFYGKWGALFAGINRANAVISLINGIEEGDFTQQMAEARFLRGHYNFELQRAWGNVPYVSEEDYAATEFNQPNTGPIWDEIEADFQFAVDNLPQAQNEIGRANSWAATAYLGKVHLYQSDWDSALPLLRTVVEEGPYGLLDDFVDNFRLAGDNSSESVFSIQFTTDATQSFNANVRGALNFPSPGPFGSCCGFYQPTQDLLNAFQTDGSGLPLLDTFNQTDVTSDFGIALDEPFEPFAGPLDPRADYTVGRRGIDYNGYGLKPGGNDWLSSEFSHLSGPYLPKKNVYWAGEEENQSTGAWGQQLSGVNYHVIRFADVILMYAEAAVETGDIDTALEMVNRVRNRAKNSNYVQAPDGGDAANYVIEPYDSFPNQEFARKAVRFERRLELGMEGHRWFDLKRWGVLVDVMNTYFVNEARTIENFGTKVGTYLPHYENFPIPINAIDLSNGVLTQNPGY